ncbi:hypothetical protein MTES_1850 [Microbacterium testaceum StLB037]|uniref:Uncharacterized protein n=1 Tax=Microbacterium testaceum (strain StLB037) TaxID=979556 RepID=E8NBY1_MICTS|nr:hypothetical protein MTES_1850 [Microbacterium testaceum StLB037]
MSLPDDPAGAAESPATPAQVAATRQDGIDEPEGTTMPVAPRSASADTGSGEVPLTRRRRANRQG